MKMVNMIQPAVPCSVIRAWTRKVEREWLPVVEVCPVVGIAAGLQVRDGKVDARAIFVCAGELRLQNQDMEGEDEAPAEYLTCDSDHRLPELVEITKAAAIERRQKLEARKDSPAAA